MDVFDELKTDNVKGIYPVAPKQNIKNNHAHPAAKSNSRQEIKPRYTGSLGDIKDEGCVEHGDTRFVIEEKSVENNSISHSKLKEYLIFSEVLGKPKCKK